MNFFGLWEPDFLYYSLWHTDGGFNYRNISDSKVDELCEQARATIDVAKRDKIYHKVQQRIFDEAHDVFLWRRKGWVAARNNVGGLDKLVDSDGNGFNFKNVWLES